MLLALKLLYGPAAAAVCGGVPVDGDGDDLSVLLLLLGMGTLL